MIENDNWNCSLDRRVFDLPKISNMIYQKKKKKKKRKERRESQRKILESRYSRMTS